MKAIALVLLLPVCCVVRADPYVSRDKPIITIEDVNRQTEAWATCAAAYQILSEMADQPALAKQLREQSNGAKLAVMMTMISDVAASMDKDDPDVARFDATLKYAQVVMVSLPKTQMTYIMADAERLKAAGHQEQAREKLMDTIKVCRRNLADQLMYIDFWRELAKTGLVTFPE